MGQQNYSFVEDLNPTRDFWNIKIRVIKKWCQSWRLDLIAIDERGQKIKMFVKDILIPQFLEKLQEDGVYIIRRCGVGEQADKYPVLPLKKKINFYRCTEVEPTCGFQGHPYGFQFKKFEEIDMELSQSALTVDVIGNVVWCGDLDIFKGKSGKDTKRLHLDLQDLYGKVLRCTLWADYAVQVSNYISNHKGEESVIAILQHAKIKYWSNSISVQNDMYGTRVFLDDEIEEMNTFHRSLILMQNGNGNSQSHLTIQTNYPVRNEFITNGVRKIVEEIRELPMWTENIDLNTDIPKVECVVLAYIRLLEEEHSWFYVAHRTCKKKVKTKVEFLKIADNITENCRMHRLIACGVISACAKRHPSFQNSGSNLGSKMRLVSLHL
uniref:uncharacterized protein LOC122604904 n=1 Tax=Erigeron canadensis TaxID=72917 RepID=UPI001CB923B5|nr:uncharacterized protein LOC122604904 [Erigeron canadensis]